jgi:hypothetical protein
MYVCSYFHGTQGLIFVVDGSDRERILQVRDELYMLLNEVVLCTNSLQPLA